MVLDPSKIGRIMMGSATPFTPLVGAIYGNVEIVSLRSTRQNRRFFVHCNLKPDSEYLPHYSAVFTSRKPTLGKETNFIGLQSKV